jgi:response regulator RpfG family c-di-GMP phosphodiesterase
MYKLLIVDDEAANLRLLERLFSRDYYCLVASSGAEAISLLEQHDVAVMITDQRMPQMTGIDLLKLTSESRPHMVRILLTGYTDVAALVEAINCGLVYMYITKPWKNDDLKLLVSRAVEHYENNKRHHALKVANERLGLRLKEMKLGLVSALTEALRAKDVYAGEHAYRTNEYAAEIAARMEVSEEDREDLAAAALLCNFGHIGIPDTLLQETGTLTPEQTVTLRSHAERGARILATIPELRNVSDLVRFHHENFDGTGYPRGLSGQQIPLACRIIRVADEYALMTHPRAFSAAITHSEAVNSLLDRAGKELDPAVVKVMAQLNPRPVDETEGQVGLVGEWHNIRPDFVDTVA